MTPNDLEDFLRDVVSARAPFREMPKLPAAESSGWKAFLERHLGLMPVRSSARSANLRNYPLWIALHPHRGAVLVKYAPGLFAWDRVECLELGTGRRFDLAPESEKELSDICALIERYDPAEQLTVRRIADFVLKPVRGLMRTAILQQAVAAMCTSLLFIINFNVLSYAVPAQNIENFRATSWLFAAAAITLGLSLYASHRSQLRMNSMLEERSEILKLSLLWSLRPKYLAAFGMDRAEQLCAMVAQAGKAGSQALLAGISALTVIPVLMLLFLRLPVFLFLTTLVIAILSTSVHVVLQLRSHRQGRRIGMLEAEGNSHLYKLLHSIMRLKFYGTTGAELDRWQRGQQGSVRSRMHLVDRVSFARESVAALGDAAQLIALFVLSIMIAKLGKQGQAVSLATAFIMLHLVNQVYKTIPRTMATFSMLGAIRIDLAEAADLMEELDTVRETSVPSVTRANASVECHRLRLPHGCRFKDEESLTLRLDRQCVVQVSGDSGAGKSTFLHCLLGIQAPEAGSIEVFGVDPARLAPAERRRIFTYLDQNVQLLPGTVRDNLKLFSLESAGDRSLWEALDRVMLLDRVRALPLGLDTPISDARRNFSTGERQRMALAQSIAKQSAILVLDEAMSGLPKDMEQAIFRNIRPLFEQIYFVSHREHMHDFAEQVIMLEARR